MMRLNRLRWAMRWLHPRDPSRPIEYGKRTSSPVPWFEKHELIVRRETRPHSYTWHWFPTAKLRDAVQLAIREYEDKRGGLK